LGGGGRPWTLYYYRGRIHVRPAPQAEAAA
jgi:hypothetical protein